MLSKFTNHEVIELGMTIFGASTTRLFLDWIGNRKTTIAIVLLQYVCGTMTGYLAYQFFEPGGERLVYTCVTTLLGRDIVSFVVSDEIRALIKETIVTFFKKILLFFTSK